MKKLISGAHEYQHKVFKSQKDLFAKLTHGQSPEVLFITCSDSRIDPNLITQTDPGDLFVLRNAGNIIPPYGAANGGEGSTIEFAVEKVGVKHIVVCGHLLCGAMKAIFNPDLLKDMPLLTAFLSNAEATKRIMLENYRDLYGEELLNIAAQENVLVQLENLRTHPCVAARLAKGDLKIHAWIYKLETGTIFGYDAHSGKFKLATELEEQLPKSRSKLAIL